MKLQIVFNTHSKEWTIVSDSKLVSGLTTSDELKALDRLGTVLMGVRILAEREAALEPRTAAGSLD